MEEHYVAVVVKQDHVKVVGAILEIVEELELVANYEK
jgi:hypothetical protein